ncbi:hypothetical protein [Rickettsia endosymbiont of Culicoides newsteadi]|uniref:hypothetical protein n=1 Tax=Rickettsia endosymbiont of Culicoides newsteadi TaxID=1961830 RepID=UPI000B9B4DE5|nr:hypothetical protein [Rickettsia endosymbiont of Culicoides newsteadi]OZG31837.1 hypothetical protein RiCNE_07500 [Rickettsia endosymbiont of Culicoides newsteadi]
MIAAVLGNMTNCKNFNEKFWWDKDFSFSTYLAEINGKPQKFEIKDPDSHEIIETIYPKIIEENNPPSSHSEALERWKEAKENFEKTLKASRDELSKLQETRNLVEEYNGLHILDTKIEEMR